MNTTGIDKRTTLWRGRNGKLWTLSDRLVETAEVIRYANKPHDLVFPISRIIDLVNDAKHMQWEWVAEKLGLSKEDRGKFPRV